MVGKYTVNFIIKSRDVQKESVIERNTSTNESDVRKQESEIFDNLTAFMKIECLKKALINIGAAGSSCW